MFSRSRLRVTRLEGTVGSQEALVVASTGGGVPASQVCAEVVEVHVPPGAVLHGICGNPGVLRMSRV